MCLLSSDPPESEKDELMEMLFSCLGLYHQYQETGEVPEGVTVSETENGLKFSTQGSFTKASE